MRKINLKIHPSIFNEVYLPYLHSDKRYNIFYGGAGSGKSVFVKQKVVWQSIERPSSKWLIIRKVGRTIRDSVFAEIVECLQDWKIYSLCKINKTDMTIELPNGSSFLFKGLDDPEKIKSIQGITDIWVEEASELTIEDFRQLDLRLRGQSKYQKQIILTYNPISATHWLKGEFHDRQRDDTTILKTTYKDNRFLDDAYIRSLEALKEKDYTYYMIYALGEWGVLGNLIYTNYIIEDIPQDPLMYGSTYTGLDFGFIDPSVALRIGYKDQEIYIFDELYQSGLTNTQLIQLLQDFTPKGELITADNAEPARIKEIRRAGFTVQPMIKDKDSVKFGIDWLKRRKIHIHPSCINTINEIQQYKYLEDKDGNVLDKPVDFMDHAMDAMRYGTSPLWRGRARVIKKPAGF
ncbi:MAG: PBSX family phage terminase large subunit [Candidatus Pacebacteria bacterium]|nr:PBSX family phage terminase large subunit [Candidatus Paceibacterota bacterium]